MSHAATLLIEDHQGFAAGVVRRFEREPLGIDWAGSWDEGYGQFRVSGHDLVVADYDLPGSQHGLQLLARIKAISPGTRLILISGALPDSAADLLRGSELVDRYLAKGPGVTDELLAEGRAAEERAAEATDWPTFAAAYLNEQDIAYDEINALDAQLRQQVEDARTG